jgi:hypothetical protein
MSHPLDMTASGGRSVDEAIKAYLRKEAMYRPWFPTLDVTPLYVRDSVLAGTQLALCQLCDGKFRQGCWTDAL